MKTTGNGFGSIAGKTALVALAAGMSLATAQAQATTNATATDNGTQAVAASSGASNTTGSMQSAQMPKEGFWGRINPFARKKWVRHQLQPIQGQVDELNGATAKNASDIKDVDQRAQAGISKAQSAADAAAQTASAAGQQAQQANAVAGQATSQVSQLQTTVNGLDQYAAKQSVTLDFRAGQQTLTEAQKQQLDQVAQAIQGKEGYLVELSAQAPGKGSYGIRNSQQLNEMIERYLVTAHNLPIYRMHAVALGNAASADSAATPGKVSRTVQVRLMENTLAAMGGATPR